MSGIGNTVHIPQDPTISPSGVCLGCKSLSNPPDLTASFPCESFFLNFLSDFTAFDLFPEDFMLVDWCYSPQAVFFLLRRNSVLRFSRNALQLLYVIDVISVKHSNIISFEESTRKAETCAPIRYTCFKTRSSLFDSPRLTAFNLFRIRIFYV